MVHGLKVKGELKFKAVNSRTGVQGEVVVWGSPNGGSVGDAHGRFNSNPVRPTSGQWRTGDVLVSLYNQNCSQGIYWGLFIFYMYQ